MASDSMILDLGNLPYEAIHDVVDDIRKTKLNLAPQILSAASFHPLTGRFARGQPPPRLQRDAPIAPSVAITSQPPVTAEGSPMKRKRKASEDEESRKRQRGRPKVDTQDESAADRRRTQIRLAQRAYRQRKETTINSLREKVANLENALGHMSKCFLEFNDLLLDSGVIVPGSAIGVHLKTTTARFLELSQHATAESDNEEEPAFTGLPKDGSVSKARRESVAGNSTRGERTPTPEDDLGPRPARSMHSSNADAIPTSGHEMQAVIPALPRSHEPRSDSDFHQSAPELPSSPSWSQFLSEVIDRPLSTTPYTYNFQETTFARRLHRAALENGFRLLSNKATSQETLQRAFRFTFTYSNRERMTKRFQEMLRRKAGDALESRTIPFVNIGGASLHYPKLDAQGRPYWPQNVVDAGRVVGPVSQSIAEDQQKYPSLDEMFTALGFDGIWFDSYEVDQYLREKGLYLTPNSSYVDIDPVLANSLKSLKTLPDLISDTSSSIQSVDSMVPTPQVIDLDKEDQFPRNLANASPSPNPNTPRYDVMELLWHHPQAPINPNTNPASSSSAYPPAPSTIDNPAPSSSLLLHPHTTAKTNPTAPAQPASNIPHIFDVDKFLETLSSQGVCLGRAPGFRKVDVDNAIVTALQEAF